MEIQTEIINSFNETNTTNDQNIQNLQLKILEFYSGLGGMILGIKKCLELYSKETSIQYEVKASFDINQLANQTYEMNFQKKVEQRSIESLTSKRIQTYEANFWTMVKKKKFSF